VEFVVRPPPEACTVEESCCCCCCCWWWCWEMLPMLLDLRFLKRSSPLGTIHRPGQAGKQFSKYPNHQSTLPQLCASTHRLAAVLLHRCCLLVLPQNFCYLFVFPPELLPRKNPRPSRSKESTANTLGNGIWDFFDSLSVGSNRNENKDISSCTNHNIHARTHTHTHTIKKNYHQMRLTK
jgi:hypothetical protein